VTRNKLDISGTPMEARIPILYKMENGALAEKVQKASDNEVKTLLEQYFKTFVIMEWEPDSSKSLSISDINDADFSDHDAQREAVNKWSKESVKYLFKVKFIGGGQKGYPERRKRTILVAVFEKEGRSKIWFWNIDPNKDECAKWLKLYDQNAPIDTGNKAKGTFGSLTQTKVYQVPNGSCLDEVGQVKDNIDLVKQILQGYLTAWLVKTKSKSTTGTTWTIQSASTKDFTREEKANRENELIGINKKPKDLYALFKVVGKCNAGVDYSNNIAVAVFKPENGSDKYETFFWEI